MFLSENVHFLEMKFSIHLNRHVFIMVLYFCFHLWFFVRKGNIIYSRYGFCLFEKECTLTETVNKRGLF